MIPREVLAAYGLSAADGWQLTQVRTLNNTVFSVQHRSSAEPAWALRVHRPGWRDADGVRAELMLLEFLDQHLPESIDVPRPGRTRADDLLVELDGRCYSLLGWLPGAPARPDTELNADAVRLLGRGLGAVHTALDRWVGHLPAPVRWNAGTLFTAEAPGLMGRDPSDLAGVLSGADLTLFAEIAERSREIFDHADDQGLIHADYILGNCHWTSVEGRQRLGILDFDDFGSGPRPFDLGAVLGNLADFTQSWPTNAAAFVAGYRTAHPLADESIAALPLMIAARHAAMCLWILGHAGADLGADHEHIRLRMQLARERLEQDPRVFIVE